MTDERHTDHEAVAPDQPPSLKIGVLMFALTVVLVVSLIGVYEYFVWATRAEVTAKQLTPVPADLARERDRTAGLLGRYEQLDAAPGRYRIPIERAMELLAARPELIRPAPGGAK